jgi:hypothetical protein
MTSRHSRSVFLLLILAFGCSAPNDTSRPAVQDLPLLKIKLIDQPIIYQMTAFKADHTFSDTSVRFYWSFWQDASTTPKDDTITYRYYSPGLYSVTCFAKRPAEDTVIARDTLKFEVTSSLLHLDEGVMRSSQKVIILFKGHSNEMSWELGKSTQSTREEYTLSLPLGSDKLFWTDSGAFFSVGDRVYDTTSNGGNPVYRETEASQRVSVVIDGSGVANAWLRSMNFSGWREGGFTHEDSKRFEFQVSGMSLYSQNSDSTIFTVGGPAMRSQFHMTSREISKTDPDPRTLLGRQYMGTDNFYLDHSMCYLIFCK